jgi:aryl-phospho-beta-D-glucosidase BglC (GH1 family)
MLNKGINLGGFLSQCEHSKEHYDTFITEKDIETIASWGFDHVRLPIDYEVFETDEGEVKPEGYEKVKEVVEWCANANINIVLDLHKAYGYDFNDAGDDVKNNLFSNENLKLRFLNLWDSISRAFKDFDNVVFELLNEVVEEQNADAWNDLIKRTVAVIRINAPEKYIIYGGIQWNSAKTLKLLEKPADDKIIFTFHFYEPLLFTHQKAYWVKTMDPTWEVNYPNTKEHYEERSKIIGDQGNAVSESSLDYIGMDFIEALVMDAINAAKDAGVKLYCGEFGVIDRAPIKDTLNWFNDVNEVFKKNDIHYAIWNYKSKDFGLVDKHYDDIREDLLKVWS